ncbi:leucine-rich repeat domain-containing protein [Flagellimonas eckloniae]|uniref:leucine-rich repeat domain-containing protein n=1 Tax=Flagellimonas eckloniae TaxID=346185 RepID=UPI000B2B7BA8|nr:leucine-rich repeat domain-containing protein [Allomuricauda eckloniae]
MGKLKFLLIGLAAHMVLNVTHAQDVSSAERQALIDLYNSTNGASWANNTNWNTSSVVSTWYGVTVVNDVVTELDLSSNLLSGTIPQSIDDLSGLTRIDFDDNQLSGTIPTSIGLLTNLEKLTFSRNQLSGSLPTEIGQLTNLDLLSLWDNSFTGAIPSNLSLLTGLVNLYLYDNMFSGGIPTALGQLSNLANLDLANNQLTGTIPTELSQLSNLFLLRLSGNQLSGTIPSGLSQLNNLTFLILGNNLLSGNVPNFTGSSLNRLEIDINAFLFSNFEAEHPTYFSNLSIYNYSPQAKVDQEETLSVAENGSITLTSTALTSTNNSYQWYKDGVAISGATSKDYVISNATATDAGVYHFEATNSVVTGLTLTRNDITLSVTAPTCGVSAAEKQALLDLYNSTNGANWTNTWDIVNDEPCDWYGVTVENGNVTMLSLNNNQLDGIIGATIGNLTNLTHLLMSSNNLSGEIPEEVGNLSNLTFLTFSANNLIGPIPKELGNLANLASLTLTRNSLSGEVPVELTNLSSLVSLYLDENKLTGNFAMNLVNTPGIITVNIQDNEFIFSNLEDSFNTLISIPTFIYGPQAKVDEEETMTVVENGSITLTSNDLTSVNNSYQWYKDGVAIAGATSKDYVISNATATDAGVYYFRALNSVVTSASGLQLTRNNITLSVTAPTCGVSAAEKQALLDLYNSTNGANWTNTWDIVNDEPCDWYGVTVENGEVIRLYLLDNNLSGTLTTELGQLTNLRGLDLRNNQIAGSIPASLGNLTSLEFLILSRNNLSSNIPSSIGNLINLKTLALNENILTGSIPSTLGNFPSLSLLILNDNNLTGNIPSTLGNLSSLTGLSIDNNNLSGNIPAELGQLGNLTQLYLYNNQLTGAIPAELGQLGNLTQLHLYNNQLTGTIPIELGQLNNLERMKLNDNQFSGNIPAELGNLSNLIELGLDNNNLQGQIPSTLNQLSNLDILDLSNNQLSGPLPNFIGIVRLTLGICNNSLVFGDFENQHISYLGTIGSYSYSPQAEVNEEETHVVCVEESLVLTTDVTGSANHYQWFKDGTPIAGAPDSATYLIQNATLADAGIYHCEVTSDIVTGLTLTRRPIEVTVSTLLEDTHNTVTSRSYDLTGNQIAAGKQFYDGLGLLEQTQSWNIRTDETWASAVLRDAFDRSALQTLSSPITSGSQFNFKEDFVMQAVNVPYTLTDYQDPLNPSTVANLENTLGWYYSEDNTDNPYQDQTDYPFSRTVYSTLNPGGVLTAFGGNKIDQTGTEEWAKTYAFTMSSGGELAHSSAFNDIAYSSRRIIKTVNRDVHGIETVVFRDTDGRVLAAARSGNEENPAQLQYGVTLEVGSQGYVDIHIPQGCTGITLGGGGPLDGQSYQIYDLTSEEQVFGTSTLPAGFYRVAFTVKEPATPYTVSHQVNYYDYSLNEYDTANRLVASYQPLGNTKAEKPVTTYEYNTLGQLIKTTSPDEGTAWFEYREDGQIRFSQNSKQLEFGNDPYSPLANGWISYTDYDAQARPVESGEISASLYYVDADASSTDPYSQRGVIQTQYDFVDTSELSGILGLPVAYHSPAFLSGNVAKTSNDNSSTYYSYDIYGRVQWVAQNITGLGAKTIDYEYDPVSGLVTKVLYQKDQTDQFVHRYTYDAAYQLTLVETSPDNSTYEEHARYFYHEDGSLRRTELAEGVQGIDYVYNLAGQLKAINHPTLDPTNDPGGDTNDLFGMALDYHNNDYKRTNTPTPVTTNAGGTDQFNGNIKSTRWNNAYQPIIGGEHRYSYTYDKNYWMTGADFEASGTATGSPQANVTSTDVVASGEVLELKAGQSVTLLPGFEAQNGSEVSVFIDTGSTTIVYGANDYDVSNITYDANGNIQSLSRNKGSQTGTNAMDDLDYTYKSNPQDGPNQLLRVDDAVGDAPDADDIDDQDGDNYVYNAIGQLVRNNTEDIDYLYNASGLVTEVQQGGQPAVKFFYNDRNHRIKKETYTNGALQYSTYYVRDVAGQVLAIYNNTGGSMALAEQPIYGGGRIGVSYVSSSAVENRLYVYELTDHLGNVRAVFTKNGTTAQEEGFTDYYPFGMPMPGRSLLGAEGYRYAFQGQEKDPETGKEAFQLRLWDSRIGRWLTTDPFGQYNNPYLGMGNNPISRIDPDGGQDCNCKDNDPPGLLPFFNSLFNDLSNFLQGIDSKEGPDYSYLDQLNKQQDVLNALTSDLKRREEFLQKANGVALTVGTGGLGLATTSGTLSASLITRGGLSALAKRGLFSFSTKGFGQRVLFETGTELLANNFNPYEVNLIGIAASVPASNLGSEFIGSAYEYSINEGFDIFTYEAAAVNFTVGRANSSIHSNLQGTSSLLGNNGSIQVMRNSFILAGQTGTKLLGNEIIGN